jgi:DNA polymerase
LCGRKITADDEFERQAFGKVPELSLGYLGGPGAFKSMMRNYGVHLEERAIVDIVHKWRAANAWAVAFGDNLRRASRAAMQRPYVSYSAGRIQYLFEPDALDGIGALWAILPSGRRLCYPSARTEAVQTPYGKTELIITAIKGSWRPAKGVDEWPRVKLWHGLLAENVTQAVATGDLLNAAIRRARERYGLTVCGHTHDEIMIETANPATDSVQLKACMLTKPHWPGADALPLHAKEGYGYRYKVESKTSSL